MSERHVMSNCQPAMRASRKALSDVHVEQLGGNLHLRYGRPQVDAAVLIGTFLIAWMAIGAVVFGWLVVHADLSVLIAVAFTGPMVVVLVLAMLRALYSEEHLRLGPQGLSYEWRVRRVLRSRHFRLEEVNGAESGRVTTYNQGALVRNCLVVETQGEPVRFAEGISEQEQASLVSLLNGHLDVLRNGQAAGARPGGVSGIAPEVLLPSAVPLKPPSDSPARLSRGVHSLAFCWRGQWNPSGIITATFVNFFSNGILGFLLYVSWSNQQWLGLFLVILFCPAGVFLFVLWFATVTAPLWRLDWVIGDQAITRVYWGFGIPWKKRFALPGEPPDPYLSRLELRRVGGGRTRRLRLVARLRPGADYALAFILPGDSPLLEIDALTEGEARWMADILFREFPEWFPGSSAIASQTSSITGPSLPYLPDVHVELLGDNMKLSYSKANWGPGCFFLYALLPWSFFCAMTVGFVIIDPGVPSILFASVFNGLGLLVFWVVLAMLCTSEKVLLHPGGLKYSRRIAIPLIRRSMPLTELRHARAGLLPVEGHMEPSTQYTTSSSATVSPAAPTPRAPAPLENCIIFETTGKPLAFARGITEQEQHWLVSFINRYLDAVRDGEEQATKLLNPALLATTGKSGGD